MVVHQSAPWNLQNHASICHDPQSLRRATSALLPQSEVALNASRIWSKLSLNPACQVGKMKTTLVACDVRLLQLLPSFTFPAR